jgi:hypothetical protein
MGWDGVNLRGETPESYVRKTLGKDVVRMATVGRAIYAAVKTDMDSEVPGLFAKGDVVGLVVLTEKSGSHTMFKWLGEFDGPVESQAPATILRELSPVRDSGHVMAGYAKEWRERCKANAVAY